MKNKIVKINPQTVFLILGLIYGISFLIITPPLQVLDEGEHFDKAVYLSEGHLIPSKSGEKFGYYIPKSEYEFKNKFGTFKDNHLANDSAGIEFAIVVR